VLSPGDEQPREPNEEGCVEAQWDQVSIVYHPALEGSEGGGREGEGRERERRRGKDRGKDRGKE